MPILFKAKLYMESFCPFNDEAARNYDVNHQNYDFNKTTTTIITLTQAVEISGQVGLAQAKY